VAHNVCCLGSFTKYLSDRNYVSQFLIKPFILDWYDMSALELFLGRSGSGKTHEILNKIQQKAIEYENNDINDGLYRKIFMLIPDQYSVLYEKMLLNLLTERLMRHVQVVSFKKLYRISRKLCPKKTNKSINNGGQLLLLAKSIDFLAENDLKWIKNDVKFDFLEMIFEAIKELRDFHVDVNMIENYAESDEKIHDILLLHSVYNTMKSDFADFDDNLNDLIKNILSGCFDNCCVFADSFNNFNGMEMSVFKAFIDKECPVCAALTTPEKFDKEDGLGIFSKMADMSQKLIKLTDDINIIYFNEQKRYKNKELFYLENSFGKEKIEKYDEELKNIELYKAIDEFDEVDYIACTISRLVRDEGYKYSDFMIISRNIDNYSASLEPLFDQYEIPLFFHKKGQIKNKAPIIFLMNLFGILIWGYDPFRFLEILKTDLLGFDFNDIAVFENYIYTWNIKYNDFTKEFVKKASGFSDEYNDSENAEILKKINEIRKKTVDLIENFREKTQNGTVFDVSKAIFDLFIEINLVETLQKKEEILRKMGEKSLYQQQQHIYEIIINMLDEFVAVAGETSMDTRKYYNLFMYIVQSNDIALIPTGLDQVTAGNIDTIPMMSPKCVFVVGLNDGIFPKKINEKNVIINDKMKKTFLEKGVQLTPFSDAQIGQERFYVYSALSSASERLFVSYSNFLNGEESRESYVINELKNKFTKLKEYQYKADQSRIQHEKASFFMLLNKQIPVLDEYYKETVYNDIIKTDDQKDVVNESQMKALFGNELNLSASKVDKFHECKFSYVCKYGLNLKKKERAVISKRELGSLIHKALEIILPKLKDIDDNELKQLVLSFLNEYYSDLYNNELTDSQNEYIRRIGKKLEKLFIFLQTEMRNSEFIPMKYELAINDTKTEQSVEPLKFQADDLIIKMTGIVDRVDVFEDDNDKFIRIIDYKTGNKTFDINKIFYGLDVQMLMYLHVLQQKSSIIFNGEAKAAGILYINANPVIVEIDRLTDENIEKSIINAQKKLQKTHKNTGLFLDQAAVKKAIENERIAIKKDSFILKQNFDLLFKYIENILKKMGNDIHSGRIEKNPVEDSNIDSCKFCDIRNICGFNGKKRTLQKFKMDDVLQNIAESEGF